MAKSYEQQKADSLRREGLREAAAKMAAVELVNDLACDYDGQIGSMREAWEVMRDEIDGYFRTQGWMVSVVSREAFDASGGRIT